MRLFLKYPGKLLWTLCLLLSLSTVKAQDGNVFLRHYQQFPEGVDNQNYAIAQGANGIMYFANSRGVMAYDGHTWELIRTPSPALSFSSDPRSGRLFVGCRNDFGYIRQDPSGKESYVSVSGDNESASISRTLVCGNAVYYFNARHIYKVNVEELRLERHWAGTGDSLFTGIFTWNDKVYLNMADKGLHELKGTMFSPVISNDHLAHEHLIFGIPYDQGHALVGMAGGRLFLFNGSALKEYTPEARTYLATNMLADGFELNKEELCFSTLAGGCVITHKHSGKTVNVINYQSGLPDDEIFSMNKDREGGIWLSHEYGITRADKTLPFRNYSIYPGLEGNILNVFATDTTLYVATSEGVYYLSQVRSFEELTKIIKKNSEKRERKRSFFSRLFRKKEKEEDPLPLKESDLSFDDTEKTYAVHYVGHVFKKVPGINDKCRQIIAAMDRLIVAGNTGLYEIRNHVATQMLKDVYINTAYYSVAERRLYIGVREGLLSFAFEGKKWMAPATIAAEMDVVSIAGYKGTLWIGGDGRMARVIQDGKGNTAVKMYDLPGSYAENVHVRQIEDKLYGLTSSGIFSYDLQGDRLVADKSLSSQQTIDLNIFQPSVTWIKMNDAWTAFFAGSAEQRISFPLLSFLKDIKGLYLDDHKNIWIIDRRNNLLKVNRERETELPRSISLLVRQITDDSGNQLSMENLTLEHNNNSLSFYFAVPFFRDEEGVQYQYRLAGLDNEWTTWSNSGTWKFTYLPSGNYVLHVRARNSQGHLSEEVIIPVHIKYPYWRTTWFYLLEIVFFVLLIGISIFLNRQNHGGMFWAKFATFMTLIIIIELIHRALQNTINLNNADSPILTFASDILLALLISPIEKLLKFFISKRRKHRRRIIKVYTRSILLRLKRA